MELRTPYHFQRIGEQHIPDIARLHRLVFNSRITEEELHRIFDTRIFGKYTIGFLAISEQGEIAAYYGVFPILGVKNGASVLVAQSGSTMTHPNHQKKGLFVTLAKLTFEAACEEGIQFIYGFPNENSFPGFKKKLNWKFQDSLQKVVLKTGTVPFCELASKNRLIKSIYRSLVKWRISKLKISPLDSSFINTSIIHSNKFLDYKLRNPDVYLINFGGVDFLVKSSPHLLIGDIRFKKTLTPAEFEFVLIQLGKIFMASKVILQYTKNHWISSFLESSSLVDSLPVGFLYFGKEAEEEIMEFNYSDLDTF